MADNPTYHLSGKGWKITGQVGLDTAAELRVCVQGGRIRFFTPLDEVTKYGDNGDTKFDDTMLYADVELAVYVISAAMPQIANLGQQHTFNMYFDLDNTAGYTGSITSESMDWVLPATRTTRGSWIFGKITGKWYGTVTEDSSDA